MHRSFVSLFSSTKMWKMFLHLYTGNRIELQENVLLFWELEEIRAIEFELLFYYLSFTNCTNSSFHYSKEDRNHQVICFKERHCFKFSTSQERKLEFKTRSTSRHHTDSLPVSYHYFSQTRFKIGRFFDSRKKEKAKEEACARGWKKIWWALLAPIVGDASASSREGDLLKFTSTY